MANTRATRQPEWAIKPLRRRTIRLCLICLKSKRRCYDARRAWRKWGKHGSWKRHRNAQWRSIEPMGLAEPAGCARNTGKGTGQK